jgi:hypothetical protein
VLLVVLYRGVRLLAVEVEPNYCGLVPSMVYYVPIPVPQDSLADNKYDYRLLRAIDYRQGSTLSSFESLLLIRNHSSIRETYSIVFCSCPFIVFSIWMFLLRLVKTLLHSIS